MINTNVPIYGIIILISITIGIIYIFLQNKKIENDKYLNMALVLYMLLGSVFGAKYFSYLSNPSRYNHEFNFFRIGLSSYGAVIGMIILLIVYSMQYKKKLKDLLYFIIPSIPLMYSIGKIGCFLAGCCYGIKYNGLFSVTYHYSHNNINGISLFPVQIVETIVFFIIFLIICYLQRKNYNKLKVISISFILCGIFKFLLDYLRASHINAFISLNQYVSIIFVIIGLILFFKKEKA